MICPVCKEDMLIIEYEHTELDYCPSCEGIWLDAGELELLFESPHKLLDLTSIKYSSKSKRRCPRCRMKMKVTRLPGSQVEVDFCPRDSGIWLDQGELLEIAQTETKNDNIKKVKKFLGNLFIEKTDQKEN